MSSTIVHSGLSLGALLGSINYYNYLKHNKKGDWGTFETLVFCFVKGCVWGSLSPIMLFDICTTKPNDKKNNLKYFYPRSVHFTDSRVQDDYKNFIKD